jgi:hypothetical protein
VLLKPRTLKDEGCGTQELQKPPAPEGGRYKAAQTGFILQKSQNEAAVSTLQELRLGGGFYQRVVRAANHFV